jgi:hypothetical protein
MRATKPRIEEHITLTVADMQRETPAGATEVTLTYQTGDVKDAGTVEERLSLEWVTAGFRGRRLYLKCPGVGCDRRVMALYFANGLFRCRHCHKLAYASQLEDARQRAMRRANKARARLGYPGWQPFTRTPMARPKRMWRSKFWRLQGAALAHDYDAQQAFAIELQNLAMRMGGRRGHRRA